jgi:hypothetical protein
MPATGLITVPARTTAKQLPGRRAADVELLFHVIVLDFMPRITELSIAAEKNNS